MVILRPIGESVVELTVQGLSREGIRGGRCRRCGGLMVGEFCMDLWNYTGELEFPASRCVQCGEIVDPVILKNRQLQGNSKAMEDRKVLVQSAWSHIAA